MFYKLVYCKVVIDCLLSYCHLAQLFHVMSDVFIGYWINYIIVKRFIFHICLQNGYCCCIHYKHKIQDWIWAIYCPLSISKTWKISRLAIRFTKKKSYIPLSTKYLYVKHSYEIQITILCLLSLNGSCG